MPGSDRRAESGGWVCAACGHTGHTGHTLALRLGSGSERVLCSDVTCAALAPWPPGPATSATHFGADPALPLSSTRCSIHALQVARESDRNKWQLPHIAACRHSADSCSGANVLARRAPLQADDSWHSCDVMSTASDTSCAQPQATAVIGGAPLVEAQSKRACSTSRLRLHLELQIGQRS